MIDSFKEKEIFKKTEELLYEPNIFTILKLDSSEIRHTNIIQWLLSIDNYKGLKELIKWCNSKSKKEIDLEKIDYKNIIFYNDKPFNQIFKNSTTTNRPDLLIEFNCNNKPYYLLIENKINAFENEYDNIYQTSLYYEEMKKLNINEVTYIFLDAKNNDPKCNEYLSLDYNILYNEIINNINLKDNREKDLYDQYIISLRRPLFDKDDILVDTIYLFDNNDINEYENFYLTYKNEIDEFIYKNTNSKELIILKYIIYCLNYNKNNIVKDSTLDYLGLSNKREKYKWKYNGITSTNLDLIRELIKDLINDDKQEYINEISKLKVGTDKLIIKNLDEELQDEGWIKYLDKHKEEKIEDFYTEVNAKETCYLRNCIRNEIMEKISEILKNSNYKIEK